MSQFSFTEIKLIFSESEMVDILRGRGYDIFMVSSSEGDSLTIATPKGSKEFKPEEYLVFPSYLIRALPEHIDNVFMAYAKGRFKEFLS